MSPLMFPCVGPLDEGSCLFSQTDLPLMAVFPPPRRGFQILNLCFPVNQVELTADSPGRDAEKFLSNLDLSVQAQV